MNKVLQKISYGFLTVGVLGVLYSAYLFTHKVEITKESQLASLLAGPADGAEQPLHLGERIKETDCEVIGPLPDPDCTPGAVFENATKEEICVSGYTKTVRSVSTSLRKKVFAEYNIEYPVPFGSYEVDHLIPLSLGGNNDIANLWPKSAEPFPGFYEKNITGNYLLEEVCKGRVDLSVAQERMADNWFSIYQNLSDQTIGDLKAKYKNWADRSLPE